MRPYQLAGQLQPGHTYQHLRTSAYLVHLRLQLRYLHPGSEEGMYHTRWYSAEKYR